MSTLGTASNMHKAEPDVVGTMRGDPHCSYCDEPIKQVPGGQGSTWIHTDTGAVAGRHGVPLMNRDDLTRVGTTKGLAVSTCDEQTFSAEQVYVFSDTVTHPSHPVYIEGWVGYSIPSRLRMTRKQASELIGLLAQALS